MSSRDALPQPQRPIDRLAAEVEREIQGRERGDREAAPTDLRDQLGRIDSLR